MNYIEYMNQFTVSDEVKSKLFIKLKQYEELNEAKKIESVDFVSRTSKRENKVRDGRTVKRRFKLAHIVSICAAFVMLLCAAVIPIAMNNNTPPTPEERVEVKVYSLGDTLTDVNGNTLRIDTVEVFDCLTFADEVITPNIGKKFLVLSGVADFSNEIYVSYENERKLFDFNANSVGLDYLFASGDSGSLPFREDIFNQYVIKEAEIVQGDIKLIFDIDDNVLSQVKDLVNSEVSSSNNFDDIDDNVSSQGNVSHSNDFNSVWLNNFTLILLDIMVEGNSTAVAPMAYRLPFDKIIIR